MGWPVLERVSHVVGLLRGLGCILVLVVNNVVTIAINLILLWVDSRWNILISQILLMLQCRLEANIAAISCFFRLIINLDVMITLCIILQQPNSSYTICIRKVLLLLLILLIRFHESFPSHSHSHVFGVPQMGE